MSWTRNLRAVVLAGLILAVAAVSTLTHPGPRLTAFGDILALTLLVVACVAMMRNVFAQSKSRAFWSLLSLGCVLWTINTAFWAYYEVIRRQELPEPCLGDVILFLHIATFSGGGPSPTPTTQRSQNPPRHPQFSDASDLVGVLVRIVVFPISMFH
jgi:uncharacterized membrane protein HdeD (DUF308 family)